VFAHEWDETPSDIADKQKTPFRYEFVPARRQPDFLYGKSFYEACSQQLDLARFDALGTFGCVSPLHGVPWVQSVHAAWLERSREFRAPLSVGRWKQKLNPLHPVLLKLEKLHFSGLDAKGNRNYRKVVALSPEVRDDLKRIYNVPENDIVLIPNGFAPHEFNVPRADELRASMRRELNLNPDDRVLVFVANEAERKGLEPLFQAMRILNDPHLKLLAVGRLAAETWQPVAEKLGLGKQVIFTGPSADVARYYAAADTFVLPTQYEPWGLVIVEAMACGLPVVTSRCAGAAVAVNENAGDEQTGFLLDNPGDSEEIAGKIKALLDSPAANGLPATRARLAASVQEYAWPTVLQRYEHTLLTAFQS